jgi:predicted PurR-regulated permease PerM
VTVLPRWLVRTCAYCLAVLVVGVTVWLSVRALAAVITVSFAVAAALLLAALMYPVTRALLHLRLPPWAASLFTLLALVGGLFGCLFLVVERAMSQLTDLQKAINDGAGRLRHLLLRPPFSLSSKDIQQGQQQILQGVEHALPSPMAGASMLLQIGTAALLMLFILFFLLKQGSSMWGWFVGWVPPPHRRTTDAAGRKAWQTLTSYVRGTVAVAFVDAIGIGVAMLFLGNPLTASLTLATFIGAFIPIVGATVSGVLAVGVTLVTVGPWAAVILLGAVIAVQQLEGNLLQPLIMGHALKLNPVAIVVTVTIGTIVGGILGAIVAVPLVAVCYRVVSFLAGREDVDEMAADGPAAGREPRRDAVGADGARPHDGAPGDGARDDGAATSDRARPLSRWTRE